MNAEPRGTYLERFKAYSALVRSTARDQWETVFSAIAHDLEPAITRAPRHVACAIHGGTDGFRLFSDWRQSGGGVCNSCGKFGDGFALLMWLHGNPFTAVVHAVGDVFGIPRPDDEKAKRAANTGGAGSAEKTIESPEKQPRAGGAAHPHAGSGAPSIAEKAYRPFDGYANGLWAEAEPVTDRNLGGEYLRSRNCVLPPVDGDLRFHPRLEHKLSGYIGPVLLARITDIATNEPISLHRTWLDESGRKAPIEKPRLPLSGYRKGGGCIRLWPNDAVTAGLGIAEGIESALSLAHAFQPVWSLIDAGNLKGLPVLAGIEALTIAADNDPAGLDASTSCARRWVAAGREVRVVRCSVDGADLNDLAVTK